MVITTVETINDALFHLSSEDVHRVYVDLDETIIAAEPDASPFFERALNAELKRVHPALDGDAAFRTTCAIWCSLQAVCDVDVVEPPADTARFLRSLRARGVEVVADACADARANAARNGLAFPVTRAKVEHALADVLGADEGPVCVVLDPPRAGLAPGVARAVRRSAKCARVVLVSCNPCGTAYRADFVVKGGGLQNTIRLLTKRGGRDAPFKLTRATPVDLFPHTPHCELVLRFDRDEAT